MRKYTKHGKDMYAPRYLANREYESPLNEIRLEKGYTLGYLSLMIGVEPIRISNLASGIESPLYAKTGKVKPWVEKLIHHLNTDLETLFPRYFCSYLASTALTDNQINEITISNYSRGFHDSSIDDIIDARKVALSVIAKVIAIKLQQQKLGQRTAIRDAKVFILRLAYEYTLEEVGNMIGGRSRDRVRQIEARCIFYIRKALKTNRFELLTEYLEQKGENNDNI